MKGSYMDYSLDTKWLGVLLGTSGAIYRDTAVCDFAVWNL